MRRISRGQAPILPDHPRPTRFGWRALLIVFCLALEVRASFHFMQIEQVVAGVNGDYSAQAIQLRMRSAGQEQVQLTRLVAWDANGENPVVLIDMGHAVAVSQTGARILAATEAFARHTEPQAIPDFVMTAPIPPSYVTAGSLTFETDDGDFIVWRLSWGGENYRGTTRGGQTNDDDGDFGPPAESPLPGDETAALHILLDAEATGTGSAADFMISESPALFVNNEGQSFILTVFSCPDETAGADADGVGLDCDFCPDDPEKSNPQRCGCGTPEADMDADGLQDCAALPAPLIEDGGNGSEDDPASDPDSSDGEDNVHADDDHAADGSDDGAASPDPNEPAMGTIGEVQYGAFCGTVSAWMWGLIAVTMFATARQRRCARARDRSHR